MISIDTMTMSRRRFLASLVGATTGAAIAACGGSPSTPTAVPKTTAPTAAPAPRATATTANTGQVTIVWLTRTDVHENQWEKNIAIPEFEKANPKVKINWINVAWAEFHPKLLTMNAAGTPPDVWVPYGSTGSRGYQAVSMVHDLTDLISGDKLDMSGFPRPVMDFFTVDGHIMAMPYSLIGSHLFYNKDLFQKAGVAFPTSDWDNKSWSLDAVITVASKLTQNYGKTDAIYGVNGHMRQGMEAWMWGGDAFSEDGYSGGYPSKCQFTSPEVRDAYTWFTDLIFKHKVAPSPVDVQAMNITTDPFLSGRVAISWTGGWGLWTYKDATFKVGVAPFPWAKTNTAAIWPDAYLLAAKSKYPESGWALIKYLAGPEGMKGFLAQIGAPPADQHLLAEWYSGYKLIPSEELKPAYEGSIKHGKIPPSHAFVDINHIQTVMNNVEQLMWNGKQSVSETLSKEQPAVSEVTSPNAGKKLAFKDGVTVVS